MKVGGKTIIQSSTKGLKTSKKANLENLLNSFAALHILNLVYVISLEEKLVPIYDTVLIQANALRDYPFFQVRGSEVIRYSQFKTKVLWLGQTS